MTISKEITNFVSRIRIVGWIALFATLILLIELNLIVTSAWGTLDLQTQLTVLGMTMAVVVALGFSRMGPDGFIKPVRRRKKR